MSLLKWADRPWFASISAFSLILGTGLTAANIFNVRAEWRQKQLQLAKELPRLRAYFLEIDREFFRQGEMNSSEFTNCPWADSGVMKQMEDPPDIEEFITPQLKDTWAANPKSVILAQNRKSSTPDQPKDAAAEEDQHFDIADCGLLTLRIENNGNSACNSVVLYADVIELPQGGRVMHYNENIFAAETSALQKLEQISFPLGELEAGKAFIFPLYVYAFLGYKYKADPARVAFGRVVIPRMIEYTNVLSEKVRQEVRIRFNTPVKLAPHIAGEG